MANGDREERSKIGATLSWQNLSVYAMDRARKTVHRQLIDNVRGAIKPGDLTAILGASGAGKSSLMTALAFRAGPGVVVHGDIRVNGVPVDSSYMRRYSGFMHQEDVFVEIMTVFEHLRFTAYMKLCGVQRSRSSDSRDVKRRINELLRDVGLTSKKDTRIGGSSGKVLSGGERKRLAFAAELLTDPKILFLDEPTSGQDAYSAGLLISQLTAFAAEGRTVLCTIHQPSSAIFDSFRRVILIADGRIAFAGTTERAIHFFTSLGYECPVNYNPADFLLETLSSPARRNDNAEDVADETPVAQRICDYFLNSDVCKEIDLTLVLERKMARFRGAGEEVTLKYSKETVGWVRLYWLIHRGLLQVSRDPSMQFARVLQNMCVATIAGLCFVGAVNLDQRGVQAVQGVIFILVSENTFFPMYAALGLIPQELPLLLREYRAGMYPVYVYYVARVVSMVPGLILEPLAFTLIIYWLVGLRATAEAFALSFLAVVMTLNVSTACGLFFSTLFDNVPLAMAWLVPFDYILMMTMGPFVKLGTLTIYLQWIKYCSWLLHSTEALTIVQWRDVYNISCETTNLDLPCITDGSQVLGRYDFNENNFWMDIIVMTATYLTFHLFAYFFLWLRCRPK